MTASTLSCDSSTLRFDDHTDLDALGIQHDEYCHRIAANLPRRPAGLCLARPKMQLTPAPDALTSHYAFSQRAWIFPSLCLGLYLSGLALMAIKLQSFWLILPALLGVLVFALTLKQLQQTKLWATPQGLHIGENASPNGAMIAWHQLAGIDVSRDWSGQTLTLMHYAGPDHSLRISHLSDPLRVKVQLEYYVLQLAKAANA